ncbi:MAG TPA: GreA/GreB family elongation factor [Salinimicrobium sp.]|nr:GreA/GreB family elongation factor [Salinimicrobium sp.]
MKYGEIIIEKKECDLLKEIISMAHYHKDPTYRGSIEKLNRELKNAKIVGQNEMPDDVIRFNSIANIEMPESINKSYQVVIPEKSDLSKGKISVLAPLGLALFGYAKGDELDWQFPTGVKTIKILDVVQESKSKTEEV